MLARQILLGGYTIPVSLQTKATAASKTYCICYLPPGVVKYCFCHWCLAAGHLVQTFLCSSIAQFFIWQSKTANQNDSIASHTTGVVEHHTEIRADFIEPLIFRKVNLRSTYLQTWFGTRDEMQCVFLYWVELVYIWRLVRISSAKHLNKSPNTRKSFCSYKMNIELSSLRNLIFLFIPSK